MPATGFSQCEFGSRSRTKVASDSPLSMPASQTRWYNSNSVFACRMASLVALRAPNMRFSRRIAFSLLKRAASRSKCSSAWEMLADMRANSETICSWSEPTWLRVTISTPTLRPLQISGSAAAAPTPALVAPSRHASERGSFRKSLLTHSRWLRNASPPTPDPSGVPSSVVSSIDRIRGRSSPQPAA